MLVERNVCNATQESSPVSFEFDIKNDKYFILLFRSLSALDMNKKGRKPNLITHNECESKYLSLPRQLALFSL